MGQANYVGKNQFSWGTKAHCILSNKRDSSQIQVHDEMTGAKEKDNWNWTWLYMRKFKTKREYSHPEAKPLKV